MKRLFKKGRAGALAAAVLTASALLLTGCHGSRENTDFTVPEAFDAAKQHEITFWAKNDTNKRQMCIRDRILTAPEFMRRMPGSIWSSCAVWTAITAG